ncbi:hypothetical protein BVC80_9087g82 [Macleaya cordata]|uniref:At5g58720/SDE5-like UBA-like domain-containing protein n=1 Tax=Macleaya cordata TaxID=56857 RepID=A0A200PQW5_MACCD|nr:hypothetical protein BVC80_9087g82 [Macleaya cordata]
MEASTSRSLEYEDGERKVLEGLIDAFGSTFSLREIASAFCKARRDPDLAAEILYDSQGNASSSSAPISHVSESETQGGLSCEPFSESISYKSSRADKNGKASKPKKHSVSMGTVSGVLGKGYAKPTTSANEACRTTKPLKLDLRDLPIAGGDVSSDSAVKNDHMHKDIEDFLFKMLGNGFQLDMDMIREVLGCCGYDAKEV